MHQNTLFCCIRPTFPYLSASLIPDNLDQICNNVSGKVLRGVVTCRMGVVSVAKVQLCRLNCNCLRVRCSIAPDSATKCAIAVPLIPVTPSWRPAWRDTAVPGDRKPYATAQLRMAPSDERHLDQLHQPMAGAQLDPKPVVSSGGGAVRPTQLRQTTSMSHSSGGLRQVALSAKSARYDRGKLELPSSDSIWT